MFFHNLNLLLLIVNTFAFYEESPYVTELDVENFEKEVTNGSDIWLLQFFSTSNDDCHAYSDEYEKIGKALNGFIKVGAVDVNRARLLAYKHNIRKLPTLIYVNKDRTVTKHKGERQAMDVVNMAVKLISKQMKDSLIEKYIDLPFIKELTTTEIDKQVKVSGRWIVGHVNSEKPDENFKTSFIHVAEKLQDNIKFGFIDYNRIEESETINEIPSMMFYFGKRSNRTELKFTGNMKSIDEIINWVLTNVKKPDVLELSSEDVLRESCVNKKYCIITLVDTPSNCDKYCRKETKYVISSLTERYKYFSATWALVKKGTMPTLEDIFGITINTKLPAMLVVNVQTLASKELEDVDEENAQSFLEDIFHGKGFPEHRLPGFDNLLQEHYKPWHDEL